MNKLEYITGCTRDSLTINDIETVEMTVSDIQKHLIQIIENNKDIGNLQQILMSIAEYGEYEDLGHCEQCGDHICKFTYSY